MNYPNNEYDRNLNDFSFSKHGNSVLTDSIFLYLQRIILPVQNLTLFDSRSIIKKFCRKTKSEYDDVTHIAENIQVDQIKLVKTKVSDLKNCLVNIEKSLLNNIELLAGNYDVATENYGFISSDNNEVFNNNSHWSKNNINCNQSKPNSTSTLDTANNFNAQKNNFSYNHPNDPNTQNFNNQQNFNKETCQFLNAINSSNEFGFYKEFLLPQDEKKLINELIDITEKIIQVLNILQYILENKLKTIEVLPTHL